MQVLKTTVSGGPEAPASAPDGGASMLRVISQ
jgi:hypothetical protein